jgi:hypothetical protein
MKTLDKEDIISRMQSTLAISDNKESSGFIYPDGLFSALYCGTTHDDQCYEADTTLEEFLAIGGCRIKIHKDLIAIEHISDLTEKQKKCIVRIIRANKFYTLIYFGLKSKIDIELNEYNGIKQYHLTNIWGN